MVNLEQLNYPKKKPAQWGERGDSSQRKPQVNFQALNELGNQLKVFFGLFNCSKFSIIYHLF